MTKAVGPDLYAEYEGCGAKRAMSHPVGHKGAVRYPTCNRTASHGGPHRQYDPKTFRQIAEWTDEECKIR